MLPANAFDIASCDRRGLRSESSACVRGEGRHLAIRQDASESGHLAVIRLAVDLDSSSTPCKTIRIKRSAGPVTQGELSREGLPHAAVVVLVARRAMAVEQLRPSSTTVSEPWAREFLVTPPIASATRHQAANCRKSCGQPTSVASDGEPPLRRQFPPCQRMPQVLRLAGQALSRQARIAPRGGELPMQADGYRRAPFQ